tara:strand:+ start:383 stop:799 length:417 start_codon:yes stop_codon:yes gene_type:complete
LGTDIEENNQKLDLLKSGNFFKEVDGEFISFDFDKEELIARFPIQERFFNPLGYLLGGMLDCFMDGTMGPLSALLGTNEVTKSFSAKYIRPTDIKIKFVKVRAWRDEADATSSIYKAELFHDNGNLAALSEAVFVKIK